MSKQTVTLKETKQCKHSVRFDNPSKNHKTLSSLYLLRPAYQELGNPTQITIEVSNGQA